jgi:hypothetical protein
MLPVLTALGAPATLANLCEQFTTSIPKTVALTYSKRQTGEGLKQADQTQARPLAIIFASHAPYCFIV